jgi:multiple sugar transport system permease protein
MATQARTLRRVAQARQDVRVQRTLTNLVSYIGLAVFLLFLLFPFYFMVVTAFKPQIEITRFEAPLGIVQPTFENVTMLFSDTSFVRWFVNSTVVAVATTAFSVVVGTLAAYALVRYRFRGAQAMGLGIFITYLLPPTLLFLPITYMVQQLGLANSLGALIVVYPTMMVPFCTWLLMGYFRALPRDLEESARVDGATHWQAFYMITLPLAAPGIVSAMIFTFTMSWSEYLYSRVLAVSDTVQTLPVGVPNALILGDVFFWGAIMIAALLGSLPVVLLYAFFMRAFVSGMTAGAVKG